MINKTSIKYYKIRSDGSLLFVEQIKNKQKRSKWKNNDGTNGNDLNYEQTKRSSECS